MVYHYSQPRPRKDEALATADPVLRALSLAAGQNRESFMARTQVCSSSNCRDRWERGQSIREASPPQRKAGFTGEGTWCRMKLQWLSFQEGTRPAIPSTLRESILD